jgi:hypothetical protein
MLPGKIIFKKETQANKYRGKDEIKFKKKKRLCGVGPDK